MRKRRLEKEFYEDELVRVKRWQHTNRDHVNEYRVEHYANNPEFAQGVRKANLKHYYANREARLAEAKAWNRRNRKHVQQKQREYYLANREELLAKAKTRRDTLKVKLNATID